MESEGGREHRFLALGRVGEWLWRQVLSHTHPDVLGVLALRYPHHPQELVDVVARVADDSAEDDQHVVDVQRAHDLVGAALVGGHGFTHLKKIAESLGVFPNSERDFRT